MSEYEIGKIYCFLREPGQAFIGKLLSYEKGERMIFEDLFLIVPVDVDGGVNVRIVPADFLHMNDSGQVFYRLLINEPFVNSVSINPDSLLYGLHAPIFGIEQDYLKMINAVSHINTAAPQAAPQPVNSSNIKI